MNISFKSEIVFKSNLLDKLVDIKKKKSKFVKNINLICYNFLLKILNEAKVEGEKERLKLP